MPNEAVAFLEDTESDVTDGLAIFKPSGRHVPQTEHGTRIPEVGLLKIRETVASMPQERLPVLVIEAECFPQLAQGVGGTRLIACARGGFLELAMKNGSPLLTIAAVRSFRSS